MIKFRPKANAAVGRPREKVVDPQSVIYRSVSGSPAQNITKTMEMMGGIENIFGADDVVVIKPNVQWWNQGAPNIAAMKALVDIIMNRPGGFHGEVIIAENCHRGPQPSNSAGWAHDFLRNADLDRISNYHDLSHHLKKTYADSFSTCHWVDVDAGNKRICSPSDGTGYIYCDGTGGVPLISFDNGHKGNGFREVIMTYPVFRTDKGTVVDFKIGIWEKDSYTDQPLKFINCAALNHHSTYCGATSAIKNYLGVSDLSGGADPNNGGRLTGNYYNFHSFPFNEWGPGPEPGMIGAEIGVFLNSIRKADLNITTAEWVGLASRTDAPVARTRAVLACEDPVALDYHATKYILFPNSKIAFHNPDDAGSPLCQYLKACAGHGGGVFDERKVEVKSWDFQKGRYQKDDELVVMGEKEWGSNPKAILKYLVMRYGSFLL